MPYPAPLTTLDDYLGLYRNPERRRALFHLAFPAVRPPASRDILIAGCGTSQAARYALREPDARVTAIDISETSLAHTRALQEKYHLDNLALQRLSLLEAEQLGRTFDLIVCTGVLHHLIDPDAGLIALRNALKPEGAMQLMVYAAHGRAGIYMVREYCHLLGIARSYEELSALGETLHALPHDHPLATLLGKGKDFRHPDALADAFLHPMDRAFTVPQIHDWLGRCGMSFGRWFEQAPYLPQCSPLARAPHAQRLAGLPEFTQHAAMELFRGTMTQHNFIAYRNDRTGESQPIRFTSEQWRNYVPVRLPWTICVRDNVPAGAAAVLLNPAHKHPDLILRLNHAQHRLFDQIDGRRTLGEIAQTSGTDVGRIVDLFRRLWQYDQIVFDATPDDLAD